MAPTWPLCAHMDPYVPIWTHIAHMGPYGPPSESMGLAQLASRCDRASSEAAGARHDVDSLREELTTLSLSLGWPYLTLQATGVVNQEL